MKSILKRIIGFGGFSNGESLLIYALILLIIFGPWLFTQSCFQDIAFGPEAAWVGDTIGGITTPFLNLLAAFLVYKAFRAQIQANEDINKQFNDIKLKELVDHNLNVFTNYLEHFSIEFVHESGNKHLTNRNAIWTCINNIGEKDDFKDRNHSNIVFTFFALRDLLRLLSSAIQNVELECREFDENKNSHLHSKIKLTYDIYIQPHISRIDSLTIESPENLATYAGYFWDLISIIIERKKVFEDGTVKAGFQRIIPVYNNHNNQNPRFLEIKKEIFSTFEKKLIETFSDKSFIVVIAFDYESTTIKRCLVYANNDVRNEIQSSLKNLKSNFPQNNHD
ncbi:MAG: hypothetical protein U0V54_01620 [Saprospiraceae bacterium]